MTMQKRPGSFTWLAAGMIFLLGSTLLFGSAAQQPALAGTEASTTPRVYAPYFDAGVSYSRSTLFWFGEVSSAANYTDARVGYTNNELVVRLHTFDRYLWYDESPAAADMTEWDTAVLYLQRNGPGGNQPGTNSFAFIAQLNHWQPRTDYQMAYRGNGTDWEPAAISFTTTTGWEGDAPNTGGDDRGWRAIFTIPFSGLGLSGPPPANETWGMGVMVYDRDAGGSTAVSYEEWPAGMNQQVPASWGELAFGLPHVTPPHLPATGSATVRHGVDGAIVPDAHVGGGSVCGQPYAPTFFDGWGNANYAGYDQFNIQNQGNIADWPCFSKYYVSFPLNAIPANKVILEATLTLYQFGNSNQGGSYDPNDPPDPSFVQIFRVTESWNEGTITWNNAPAAVERVGGGVVDPLPDVPAWPGVPRTFEVTLAATKAYAAGEPLQLVLYSSDWPLHSGKYFFSSDNNLEGRPQLHVTWGNGTPPPPLTEKAFLPIIRW